MFNEEEFISQLSIDCVIFGYQEDQLKVLIPKLDLEGDFCTLPGGFILQNESINEAALRVLYQRTGIKDIYLQQYHVFGDVPRNNHKVLEEIRLLNKKELLKNNLEEKFLKWFSSRFVSIGFYALVDINKVSPKLMEIDKSIDWFDINNLPTMIMDHKEQVNKALETLRLNLDNKLLGFNLLPEKFTMKDLQQLYEAVYDRPFRRNNFQKKMLDMGVLERLEKKFTGAANKAPYLYRFKNKNI